MHQKVACDICGELFEGLCMEITKQINEHRKKHQMNDTPELLELKAQARWGHEARQKLEQLNEA